MTRRPYAELADHHAELAEWFGKLADWHNIVSWRETDANYFRQIETEEFAIANIYRRLAKQEEEREQMRKSIITSVVLALMALLLLVGLPLRAQDVPLVTNTPEAVVQPVGTAVVSVNGGEPVSVPIVEVPVEPSNNTLYVIGFLVLAAFTGLREFISNKQIGTLVTTVNKALDNKGVVDEATRLYMQSSLPVQEFVKLLTSVTGFAGAMIPGEDLAEQLHNFGDKVLGAAQPTNETSTKTAGLVGQNPASSSEGLVG